MRVYLLLRCEYVPGDKECKSEVLEIYDDLEGANTAAKAAFESIWTVYADHGDARRKVYMVDDIGECHVARMRIPGSPDRIEIRVQEREVLSKSAQTGRRSGEVLAEGMESQDPGNTAADGLHGDDVTRRYRTLAPAAPVPFPPALTDEGMMMQRPPMRKNATQSSRTSKPIEKPALRTLIPFPNPANNINPIKAWFSNPVNSHLGYWDGKREDQSIPKLKEYASVDKTNMWESLVESLEATTNMKRDAINKHYRETYEALKLESRKDITDKQLNEIADIAGRRIFKVCEVYWKDDLEDWIMKAARGYCRRGVSTAKNYHRSGNAARKEGAKA